MMNKKQNKKGKEETKKMFPLHVVVLVWYFSNTATQRTQLLTHGNITVANLTYIRIKENLYLTLTYNLKISG